jgi:methionyl aminopeptidase
MIIKNDYQLICLKKAASLVHHILISLKEQTKIGSTGIEINFLAKSMIDQYENVASAFFNYNGYPAYICVSLNEELIHGIPDQRKFKDGDLITFDFGVSYNGYHADSAISFILGKENGKKKNILNVTKNAFQEVLKYLKSGIHVGTIGNIIQKYVEKNNYYVVEDYSGHGIGLKLHEEPAIPNFGKINQGKKLKTGEVICIEPMVLSTTSSTYLGIDDWKVFPKDNLISCHLEETILITKDGYQILTKKGELPKLKK